MTNRLAHSTSPYLLQHAENPVDWWEFSPEAFTEARERDVPVLLSVGYAACHWCHVMAHESFEDPEIGRVVNEHFVAVKVDREQRPDVDSTYMAATQLLTGQGGWPMTVFLTPEGRAFHAGTYFPPRPVQGRPSFGQVLAAVTEAWTERRDEVLRGADQVTEALSRHPELVERMLAEAGPAVVNPPGEETDDAAHEGFGTSAKFPPSPVLDALTRVARGPSPVTTGRGSTDAQGQPRAEPRADEAADAPAVEGPATGRDGSGHGSPENGSTGSAHAAAEQRRRSARELLCATLDAIVRGALQDHVGGGFFRYSVTPDWSLPHFEKMLYDNAQLLRVLARTVELLEREGTDPAREARYRGAADALVEWLHREMITGEGAFSASLDADSAPAADEPHAEREGAYYTFSRDRGSRRGADRGLPEPVTADWGEAGALTGILDESVRRELWERRVAREAPHRDDKVVTAWNGMMITGLAEAAVLLDRPQWLETADAAAQFLWRHHWDSARGTLARTSRGGAVDAHEGALEDYACFGAGLLALYRATGETTWYERSRELADATVRRFVRDGRVLESAELDVTLAAAGATGRAEPFDDVAASSAAVLGRWLSELSRPEVGGRDTREVVAAVTQPATGVVLKAPTAAGGMVSAVLAAEQPPQLLQVADASPEQWRELLEAVGAARVLDTLVLDSRVAPYGTPSDTGAGFTVWRCRDGRCELPVHSVAELLRRS